MFHYSHGHDGFGEAPTPMPSIAGDDAEVLPRISRDELHRMLRRLPPEDLERALRDRLVPVVDVAGLVLHVACGPSAMTRARQRGLKVVGSSAPEDFLAAARMSHGPQLLAEATFALARRMPRYSARRRLTVQQAAVLLLALAFIAAMVCLLPFGVVWFLGAFVGGLFFLSVLTLRLLCLMPPVARRAPEPPPLPEERLPVYSVLVPLFRETAVLEQLVDALSGLSYPPEKLDIKLILEDEDIPMQRALARLALPAQFEVILVPAGHPQTKPRALNYALAFCRGELLTIYDAEDIPESDQLLKAARRFAAAPRELACLQAKLTFFNPEENWLARQFSAEYEVLFGLLLPALADHRLPLPLGGTSNHFRIAALRQAGAWDPFNVTEDADLGLRLARMGYDAETLDSVTLEEANTRLRNWMRQRARWLKGFLATWLVHMREPARLLQELGPAGFWTAQAVTMGVFASVLLHPFCLVPTLWLMMSQPLAPAGAGIAVLAAAALNLLVLVAGYALSILLTWKALTRRGIAQRWATLLTLPFYWLLMSGAAWLALWQFLSAPFHWNKTEHGLSRQRGGSFGRAQPMRLRPRRGIG